MRQIYTLGGKSATRTREILGFSEFGNESF
jgi:hypothetical protein